MLYSFIWDRLMFVIPQEILQFVTRLILVANKNGKSLHIVTDDGWTAHPVLVSFILISLDHAYNYCLD